jgi:hypothetical protein
MSSVQHGRHPTQQHSRSRGQVPSWGMACAFYTGRRCEKCIVMFQIEHVALRVYDFMTILVPLPSLDVFLDGQQCLFGFLQGSGSLQITEEVECVRCEEGD